jgi:hypothetical protein
MKNTWMQVLNSQQADGTALTNNTTETSIAHIAALYTLPADFLERLGDTLSFVAMGRMSTVVTTPGTMTFRIKFGSIAVWDSGALSLNIVAKTNVPWRLDIDMTLRAIGSGTSANAWGLGRFQSEAVIGAGLPTVTGNGVLLCPVSAPAVGAGFNSKATQQVDLTAQWSVANAANSIRCDVFRPRSEL